MDQRHDLEVVLRGRTPVIVIETRDEARMLETLQSMAIRAASESYLPLFRWTITDGLQRIDIELEPQTMNADPTDVLKHIRAVNKPGVYVLLDFHPFLSDPLNVRLIKDICINYPSVPRQLILMSHEVELPSELKPFSARFDLALPTEKERRDIIERVAAEWSRDNSGVRVQADAKAYRLLVENLAGLTHTDTEQLARNAIYVDGAITKSDLPAVMQAKYALMNRGDALQYEYDTAKFQDIGGLKKLKRWLEQRKSALLGTKSTKHLDPPKGILLLGIQGCGKSLAAKATAGIFGVPLLRLDFGTIYNKYHGETERKLRESLETADVMSPCVLWIDEIEKGIAGRGGETGTSQRVLGTFLTWMSERRSRTFIVATANDISELPPELVRKGRFDEIFFIDLPDAATRATIISIHLAKREQSPEKFRLDEIVRTTDGFSGAEIEQVIVSALYAAHAQGEVVDTAHIISEAAATRPLAVVMSERVAALRAWADGRTVPCD